MRIAWTGPVGEDGGVPSMGLLMLRELLAQGVEVDLYLTTHDWLALPVEPTQGLRLVTRRSSWAYDRWYSRNRLGALFSGLLTRSLNSVLLGARLLIEHRRRRYDAVFQLSQTELFVLGYFRRAAPPIVVHPCTHAAGELRWHRAEQKYALRSERRSLHLTVRAWLKVRSRLQPRELKRADLVVGPSQRFIELVHQDYGVPSDKLRVLRHPIDLARFTSAPPSPRRSPRTLLFVSRMSTRKGVPEIVGLSHRLTDLAGSIRLLVVGGAIQWSDYSAHLADLNPAVAEYVGVVASAELPALMRSASMLLVPSRYEPGSIVTGEALACGLPVVLSDEVGPVEVVQGPHMRSHRAGDVDSLEAAVRSLLAALDEDEQGLREAARASAERHFAPDVVVKQLVDLLSSVPARQPWRRSGPAIFSAAHRYVTRRDS